MIIVGEAREDTRPVVTEDISALPTIRELRRRGNIRVLVNSYTPRLSMRDEPGGPLKGVEIDLSKLLAAIIFEGSTDHASNIEFVESANDQKVDLLAEREVDLIISNFTDTTERRKRVDFAGHYISMRYVPLLGPDAPDVNSIEDLSGLRVACEAGTSDEAVLARIAPNAHIVPMESEPDEWIKALEEGRIEAFWGDTVVDPARVESNPLIRQGSLRAGIGHSAVGVNKGSHDLRRLVNDSVASMVSSGRLASTLRRWGL